MSDFDSKSYRDAFVDSFPKTHIAFQLREMRKARGMTQADLAKAMNTTQSAVSRLENPDYGFDVGTLIAAANALDVALMVRFVPFSELVGFTKDLSPEVLAVPSYEDECAQDIAGEWRCREVE